MNKQMKKITLILTIIISGIFSTYILAEQIDHSKHQMVDHSKMQKKQAMKKMISKRLQQMDEIPVSGKSREAGFDKKYTMESTINKNNLSERCAQASRGLVMLDNKEWEKCGGKVKGTAMGNLAVDTMDNGQGEQMNHSTMDHSNMDHSQ